MKSLRNSVLLGLAIITLSSAGASAETAQVQLQQRLEDPIARISFKNGGGGTIDNPSLSFPMRTASFKCQTPTNGGPVTTLGTPNQKLYVSVPDRVSNGWDVSIAPTNGTLAGWSNADGNQLAVDDATAGGCAASGSRPNNWGGLLTIDPSSLTTDGTCSVGCGDAFTQPLKGSETSLAQSESVSLYHSDMPHVGWEGTIQNVKLHQTIPAGVPAGDYSLPMTLTLTEL